MACGLAPEGDHSRIPAAYQKIQDRTKTWISRDQSVYVETEGHRQAVRQLDQRGAVVITGPEGSGKSALGHALLRHYWRHHAHTPLDVRDHEEWRQHVDVRKGRQVVLLDDVFGSEEFSYTSYKTWARDLFHMQDSVRSSAFLVVITIRADVMEEMDLKCNFRDLFRHGPVLDLGSAECFRESEKLEMLRKHVENRDGASVDENKLRDMIVTATLKTDVGFPLQCMILAKDCEAGDEQGKGDNPQPESSTVHTEASETSGGWPGVINADLVLACKAGEVQQLSTLIKNQHCADSTDKKGNTALLIACKYGHLEAVKELIDLGANVWTENDKYWSSLHMAASNGDFGIVRFLLDSGLCAEGTDWTPVHVACSKGHGQLIPVMVHEETDLEPTDEGTTAL